jgi:hypothetical protein
MGRACSSHGALRNVYRNFMERPEGYTQLGRPKIGWEDNTKADLTNLIKCY